MRIYHSKKSVKNANHLKYAFTENRQFIPADLYKEHQNSKDPEEQFIEEIKTHLEGTLLRYSARLKLFKYAEKLGIDRFRANLLIAQTQLQAYKTPYKKPKNNSHREIPQTTKSTFKDKVILIGTILLISAFIDLIIIRILFH